MANSNITKVRLLNVPLENDYKNTIYFDDKSDQAEYFSSRIVAQYEDLSYQKADNIIRIPARDKNGLATDYDHLVNLGVNYIMFQNTAYTNKWYYAFITDLKYVNDERTDITIEIDCMQTWLFDYNVKPSFVEREHVSDDTIGKHTIPEGLETGEFVNIFSEDVDLGEMCIIVGTTQDHATKVGGAMYGGCFSGVYYKFYKATDYVDVIDFLETMAEEYSASDAITSVFMLPYFFIKDIVDLDLNLANGTFQATQTAKYIGKRDDLLAGGFAPKNKKLFTYPYNFLSVSNNGGGSAVYKYEDFENEPESGIAGACNFNIYGVVCPGGSLKIVPLYYKNKDENVEEGLTGCKFPICNWNTDVYTNWLTQNSVNIGMNVGSSALQVVGGLAMGAFGGIGAVAGAGTVVSGVKGIADTLAQVHQQSFTPPQAEGNLNCGDVTWGMKKSTFTMSQMSIKPEYAQIIDNYFSMFGYKVNRVKLPNKCHRSRYWYTKTIDVNIDGAIPNNYLQVIKNCYNNGITFWRNGDEVQRYDLDNEIAITDGAITDVE